MTFEISFIKDSIVSKKKSFYFWVSKSGYGNADGIEPTLLLKAIAEVGHHWKLFRSTAESQWQDIPGPV